MLKRRSDSLRSEQGATVVEFAIAIPVLLVLTFAVIEFAFFISSRTAVVLAAGEAVRRGSAPGSGSGGCLTRVQDIFEEEFDRTNIPHLITLGSATAAKTSLAAGGVTIPLIRLDVRATSACILLCPFVGKEFRIEPLAVAEDPAC